MGSGTSNITRVDARYFVCDSPALAQLAFTLLSVLAPALLAADLSICVAQPATDSTGWPGGYETTVTSDDSGASESQSFQKRCEPRLEYNDMSQQEPTRDSRVGSLKKQLPTQSLPNYHKSLTPNKNKS